MGTINNPSQSTNNGQLQAETLNYYNRIITAGGTINITDLIALDSFVITGKKDGWWSAVKFFAPMMGNSLNSALVKFVVDASGINSLGNVNFIEADYSPQFGFNLTANTNKRMTTGFIPVNNGIGPNNIAALVCIPLQTPASGGQAYVISDLYSDQSGRYPLIKFNYGQGSSWEIATNLTTSAQIFALSPGSAKTQYMTSINGTAGNTYINGVSSSTGTIATSSAVFSSEISLYANYFGSTSFRYTKGSLGGFLFTTALSTTQNASLAKAYYLLNKAIKRAHFETPLFAWFGDSITGWVGGSPGYSAVASNSLYHYELNFGIPSSKVVGINSINLAVPFLTRYLEIINNNYGANAIGVMGGTNDMLTDSNANGTTATISAYQAGLVTIYNAFKATFPKVIAVGLPYNTNVNSTKLAAYYNANVAAANSAGILYVDCNTIYTDSQETAAALMADGTHPTTIYHQLIGEHVAAALKGRIYRDAKIPVTTVAANSSSNLLLSLIGIRAQHVLSIGTPQTPTNGIVFTVAYTANDQVTITISNTTASSITTALTQVRVQFMID